MLDDLAAEVAALAAVLHGLDGRAWDAPTASTGWRVRDQVAHLAEGEELALLAATDPEAFAGRLAHLLADLDATAAAMAAGAGAVDPLASLARWESAAASLQAALAAWPEDARIGWVTGPMSLRSFATARLMETFAHGWDVAEAVGVEVRPTARLRHVAHLGVRTRGFTFANRGLPVPPAEPRVVLEGPGGPWRWGPEGAAERVEGPVLDFCLVVTQRRHRSRTSLVATGPGADAWLEIAQCFAGPPTAADPDRSIPLR